MPEQNSNTPINSKEQKLTFYDRLKEELENNSVWPTKYMYKFIVPNKEGNVEQVQSRFDNKNINLKKNYSKTGKYVSITIVTEEKNPETVINRYKAMENIEGLVAL